MADIHTILLLPSDGDPHGLLAPGAPVAQQQSRGQGWQTGWAVADGMVAWDHGTFNQPWGLSERPLFPRLGQDGKPVRLGLAIASWAMEALDDWGPDEDLDYYSP